jgi:hypothetical protein
VRLAGDLSCGITAGGRREAGGRLRQGRQQKIPICRMFSTGATGLEPATSGVTGRIGYNDAQRRASLNNLICRLLFALRRLHIAWLSRSSNQRSGHEWATKCCLGKTIHLRLSRWRAPSGKSHAIPAGSASERGLPRSTTTGTEPHNAQEGPGLRSYNRVFGPCEAGLWVPAGTETGARLRGLAVSRALAARPQPCDDG